VTDATSITSVNIIITAPVKGATPNTTADGSGNFTIGSVSWLPPSTTLFLGGTVYTAVVTLTANSGHNFTGLSFATINGQNATVSNNSGAAGTYTVTFDVAAAGDFNAVSGLLAGTLTIEKATPTAADFTIGGTGPTYDGSSKTVTVTPKEGKSNGTITVYYNGSTGAPSATGEYTVTFDVMDATNWNAASGLIAGTLRITIIVLPLLLSKSLMGYQ
jgi:hypothetical protein